jgi:hypothetical protein
MRFVFLAADSIRSVIGISTAPLRLDRFSVCDWAMAMAMVFLSAANTFAAVIGASVGPGSSTTSTYNKAGTGWFIDDGTFPAGFGRQPVAYDPSAGPWHKVLNGPDGGVFTQRDIDLPLGITEWVTVSGTTPWTDWHEEISQLGWRFIDDRAGSGDPNIMHSDGTPLAGLTITFTDPTPTSGGRIDFKFDPVPPGTNLNINKRIVYDGLSPATGEVFIGTLDMYEYPTVPEPAGLALAIQLTAVVALAVSTARCRIHRSRAN